MPVVFTELRPSPFGVCLRQARLDARVSLRALAEQLQVDAVLLGDVERGKVAALPRELWPGLATALGVPLARWEQAVAS